MCERPLRPHFAEPLRAAHPESRFGCEWITNDEAVKFQLKFLLRDQRTLCAVATTTTTDDVKGALSGWRAPSSFCFSNRTQGLSATSGT